MSLCVYIIQKFLSIILITQVELCKTISNGLKLSWNKTKKSNFNFTPKEHGIGNCFSFLCVLILVQVLFDEKYDMILHWIKERSWIYILYCYMFYVMSAWVKAILSYILFYFIFS